MAQQKQLIGHVKGDPGEAAGFGTITATIEEAESPSVDASWEGPNTGKNLTLTFKGIKGPAGPAGPAGPSGAAGDAGKDGKIESVTVTSDNTHSDNPTAEVTMGGEPGAQTVEIAFTGLQGAPGKDGAAAAIGDIKATVDQSTGEPSVDVQTDGSEQNKTVTINFHNIKGETGADGAPGKDAVIETVNVKVDDQHLESPTATATVEGSTVSFDFKGLVGATGKDGADAGFGTVTATVDGDAEGEQSVEASWDGENTSKNLTLAFHNLKGANGDAGPKGDTGGYYKPTVSEDGQLSFEAVDGAEELEETWQVKGADGQTGPAGKDAGIESVTVTVDAQHLAVPTATAEVSGETGAQTIAFDFKGLVGPAGTDGAKGDTGGYYKPTVSPEGQLSFTAENGADPIQETWDIKGPQGENGIPGKDGINAKIETVTVQVDAEHSDSPSATATVEGEAGAQTLALDFKGLMGATGPKGDNGTDGAKGDTGGYYKPTVSEAGELSFTAMNGAEEVSDKWNIKGADGAKGDMGNPGIDAKISTVNITVDAQHLAEPTATASISGDAGDQTLTLDFKGLAGADGATGKDGAAGAKGDAGGYYTPTVDESGQLSFTAQNGAPELQTTWNIKGADGQAGAAGPAGPAGPTGANGIDAKITAVTVSSDATHLDQPTATATVSGEPGAQTIDIKFTGLQGAAGADGKDFKPGGAATDVTLGDGTTKAISELANDEGFVNALLANQTFLAQLTEKLPFLEVTSAS